jgi:N-acetylglucosaminyldiphosphoundecaprenol N-acetyl-beta-D-mannosaminyltransferase
VINSGKRNVLGVLVDVIDYVAATERVLSAARERQPFALTALAVHGVMTGVLDASHGARLNSFDVVAPDGQPVRWALNLLHRAGLTDRVYGPSLMIEILRRCADEGLPVYLYGSTGRTMHRLLTALGTDLPELRIAGAECSKFRDARPGEDVRLARRIGLSGARAVLVGLGCPRQEIFAYAMRPLLDMPLIAVGAAFDYHAGQLRQPPAWMQRGGLEWLWRLFLEPLRLWRRYLLLNPAYLVRLFAQKYGFWPATPAAPSVLPPASFTI